MFKPLQSAQSKKVISKSKELAGMSALLASPVISLHAEPSLIADNITYTSMPVYLIALVILALVTGLMLLKASLLKKDALDAKETIVRQAHYDSQTGLPNRTLFQMQLQKEIKSSRIRSVPLALLFIDLDLFKDVNDQYGHAAGDQLLSDVARRLRGCVKQNDKVARLAGDEFTVIITDAHDINIINEVTEKILLSLSTPFEIDGALVSITSSIGSTTYPNDASSIKDLMKNADLAMYESKRLGKNRHQPFTKVLQDKVTHKQTIAKDLKFAVAEDEFTLVYQPVIDLKRNTMVKAEALIRWNHPTKGLINPEEFIDIAETSDVISQIGDWVFKKSLHDVLRLQQKINPEFSVSLNVSPKQLSGNNSLVTKWPELLRIYGLPANSIGIEITEGLLLESNPMTSTILNNLRDAGARLLIDDFGTGYSSLSYLKKLDVDFIKIDQSFVKNLSRGSEDMVLCETIIVMAHKLGLKVIAEGIETAEQRDLLVNIGCDFGQGYLFAKPQPINELINTYESQSVSNKIIPLFG